MKITIVDDVSNSRTVINLPKDAKFEDIPKHCKGLAVPGETYNVLYEGNDVKTFASERVSSRVSPDNAVFHIRYQDEKRIVAISSSVPTVQIQMINTENGQELSTEVRNNVTFEDILVKAKQFSKTDNCIVMIGGEDIKKFGKAELNSHTHSRDEVMTFNITYPKKLTVFAKPKSFVPSVPMMKIQIMVNGKPQSIQVKQSASFDDILKNVKEMIAEDKLTVTFDGKNIEQFKKEKIVRHTKSFDGKDIMKFHVKYPKGRPRPARANTFFQEEEKDVAETEVKDEEEFLNLTETPTIMLKSVSVKDDKVVIDMSWGYSSDQRDFTDVACMIFSKKEHVATVDLDNKSWTHDGKEVVSYSGRGMNDRNKRGFQTFDILIHSLPEIVTHLFMTMSAWSNPDLSTTKHPSLRFYDSKNGQADLCNTTATAPPKAETMIMSYMEREASGCNWKLNKSGQASGGNAINYQPVIETIQGIIDPEESDILDINDITTELMSGCKMPLSINRLLESDAVAGPVEIVFSFDTTGSMYNYLEEVRKYVHETISELMKEVPTLRICVFAHGDYCDTDVYVTKNTNFSTDREKLCEFVDTVEPTHGGDYPECYELVLHEARTKLSWSPSSQKSLVMIGDAIPHEKNEAQNHLSLDWRTEAQALYQEKGVRIYAIQCNDESDSEEFWKTVATIGHGKHLGLNNFEEIVKLLKMISKREGAIA